MWRAPRLWHDRRGGVGIEFALCFAALVMIIVGTIEFGRALAMRNQMSHALGQVVRVVHLDSTVTTEEIVERLEEYLENFDADLEVSITEVAGTSFMEISVEFPFDVAVPFMPVSTINLRVATLAPMVSPTS